MVFDHRCHSDRINLAQVVANQDVAKTADLSPRDMRVFDFHRIGQLLGGFRQGLQIAKRRVVQRT